LEFSRYISAASWNLFSAMKMSPRISGVSTTADFFGAGDVNPVSDALRKTLDGGVDCWAAAAGINTWAVPILIATSQRLETMVNLPGSYGFGRL
jgi:hypothetical protein